MAGQRDPPEGLAPVGAEAARGLLLVVADLLEHRHHLADHQRQRDEDGGHDHARRGEDDLEAGPLQRRAEPAVAAVVDEHQREADDDRRDRERYVEQRAQDPLAPEVVAHQQDRDGQPEDQVDQHREEGDVDGQGERVRDLRRRGASRSRRRARAERALEDEVRSARRPASRRSRRRRCAAPSARRRARGRTTPACAASRLGGLGGSARGCQLSRRASLLWSTSSTTMTTSATTSRIAATAEAAGLVAVLDEGRRARRPPRCDRAGCRTAAPASRTR